MNLKNIETYTPYYFKEILSSGRNSPFLCEATNQNMQEISLVVKPFYKEFSTISACKELIASVIAQHLGIKVATPILVDLTNDFIELYIKSSDLQSGICFGCVWAGNDFVDFLKNTDIQNKILALLASQIFLFDVFIENIDRRVEKPNLKIDKKNNTFVIFDHELAFSFLERFSFLATDNTWIKGHIFYTYLSQISKEDWDNYVEKFITKVKTIDNNFWDFVKKNIPKQWQNSGEIERINEIQKYLNTEIQNINVFEQKLKNIFSQ